MDWTPDSLPVMGVVCGAALLFTIVRYAFTAEAWARRLPGVAGALGVPPQAGGVILRRLCAGLWLGGGMLACEALAGATVGRGLAAPGTAALPWVGGALAVLAPLLWRSGGTAAVRASQPEIRDVRWTGRLRALSLGRWLIYLAGYEYLFRGGLLFTLAQDLGGWPAIAISAALYTLAHLHKPMMGETLGSLPMGLLLGAMSLATGSFAPAWAVHVGIAWTTELSAARPPRPPAPGA